ncbi:hypothetical protein SBADM41S_08771 [Streptomyces badius]
MRGRSERTEGDNRIRYRPRRAKSSTCATAWTAISSQGHATGTTRANVTAGARASTHSSGAGRPYRAARR